MTDLRAQLQAGLGGTYTLERARAILTVLDSGDAAGRLWFTIPFVEGESLRDRLRRERQLPVEDALRIAREAAQALQNAHGHGVIHRDIKPENLLLTDDGNTLVADFGIARTLGTGGQEKLTETGPVVGTPAYMSPEQAAGDKGLDARTDVYSLAAVLYEMLGGEPPFTGATTQAMLVEGDRRRAAAYGDSARGAFEQQLYAAPDNNQLHALYGVALAYAGRKDAAIRKRPSRCGARQPVVAARQLQPAPAGAHLHPDRRTGQGARGAGVAAGAVAPGGSHVRPAPEQSAVQAAGEQRFATIVTAE
jgi:serine/threonine protein kinase